MVSEKAIIPKAQGEISTKFELFEGEDIQSVFNRLTAQFPICRVLKGKTDPFYANMSEKTLRNILGGKGYGLFEGNRRYGKTPSTFIIPIQYCEAYAAYGKPFMDLLMDEVFLVVKEVEEHTGKKFGDVQKYLMISCRSGAAKSMPGMMDTILNLALTRILINAIIVHNPEKEVWLLDCYRRLVHKFSTIVYADQVKVGDEDPFKSVEERYLAESGVEKPHQLSAEILREMCDEYESISQIPQDWQTQLREAIVAVFDSFNNERCYDYRRNNQLLDELTGTAVSGCQMLFGNYDDQSGTLVAFSANIITGDEAPTGVVVHKGQGDDAVDGSSKTQPLESLLDWAPEAYFEIKELLAQLEEDCGYPQDVEITIQTNEVFLLQNRDIKPSGPAAVKIGNRYIDKGKMTVKEYLTKRLTATNLMQCISSRIDPDLGDISNKVLLKGTATSYGAGAGVAVFTKADAKAMRNKQIPFVYFAEMTTPDDFSDCMLPSVGVVTTKGGPGCHAAINTVKDGIPCITDCEGHVDVHAKTITFGNKIIKHGDEVTIDGGSGLLYTGKLKLVDPDLEEKDLARTIKYIAGLEELPVRMNAEVPRQINLGNKLGGQGIGLKRIEDFIMNNDELLNLFREYYLIDDEAERSKRLRSMRILMTELLKNSFRLLDGRAVNIRLIDPPFAEFFKISRSTLNKLSKATGQSIADIKEKIADLHEENTMMGYRGVRLGIVDPQLTEVCVHAILAATQLVEEEGVVVYPEIMVPLVSSVTELEHQVKIIDKLNQQFDCKRLKKYVMIETPAAAKIAGKLAKLVDGFSFGTNDLTQLTLGVSRDDYYKFLDKYVKSGIWKYNPFETIEEDAVLPLIVEAIAAGKAANPKLVCGICGEHGGDPRSIKLFIQAGGDYVSCSPKRILGARLTMAQIELEKAA